MLPVGVEELTKAGHQVFVEKQAGQGSGLPDEVYAQHGAEIVDNPKQVFSQADLIVKVKEPQESEWPLLRDGQMLFTYFHFAADETLTRGVLETGVTALAYETLRGPKGDLPCLTPMSEVAGRMASQEGAKYLEKSQGGRGILLGGIPGVKPANVLVIGGGVVGVNAAKIAAGMGANTTIMDISMPRLRYLDDVMSKNVDTMFSSESNIRSLLPDVDMVIGAVLKPGAKAPHLITREMLGSMQKGAVLVDVAIDQGGCFETSKPTTHDHPIYEVDDVVHYCVTNMPGAVPYTSTLGLTNVTLPYAVDIANKGWKQALDEDAELQKGLNIVGGEIVYQDVADAFDTNHKSIESVL